MSSSSLRGFQIKEIESIVKAAGEKSFRTKQLYEFIFQPSKKNWDDSSNLPKKLISSLKKHYSFTSLARLDRLKAADKSIKYLFETQHDERIESVILYSHKGKRVTACLSSQVGCKFACRFCVSGSKGFFRNLRADEIVDQYFMMQQEEHAPITNLVMMGMGEPFDNYDNVVKALRIINSPDAIGLGARSITVSTVGIAPKILQFANEGMNQIKLAISLHAPNDELRAQIMPINKKYKIKDLIQALQKTKDLFKRTVTFEYILFAQVNDTEKHAKELAVLAKRSGAKVNLIVYNSTGFGMPDGELFKRSSEEAMRKFCNTLERENIIHTIRRSGGSDIGAACGQLSLGRSSSGQ